MNPDFLDYLSRTSVDAYLVTDDGGKILHANGAAASLYGYGPDELRSLNILDLQDPEDAEEAQRHAELVVASGAHRFATRHRHRNGRIIHVEVTASFLRKERTFLHLLRDLPERASTEARLATEKKLLQSIINTVPVRVFWKDRNSVYLGCNQAFARDAGAAGPEEVIGKDDYQLAWREQAERYRADDRRTIESELPTIAYVEPQTTADGRLLWLRTSKLPLRNDDGEVIGVLGMYEDITDRRQAEEDLRETQELFALFMRYSPIYTYIKQIEENRSRVLQLSDNFVEMVGRPAEELRGLTMEEIFPPDFAQKMTEDDLTVVGKGSIIRLDEELNGRSYTTIKFPIIREGKDSLLAGFTIDITDRKQIEEALKHSHELMRYVIEHNRSAIAVHDRDMRYLYVSQRYLDDYKVKDPDVIGKHHYEVFPDLPQKWRDVHQRALAGEVSSAEEDPYVKDDGSVEWARWECRPWYEADGSIGGIIVYTEVITDRKRAEEERLRLEQQVLHAQKLESLGVLAGGIAHDFNNILTSILGNVELALLQLPHEAKARENLLRVEKAAVRATELAKQMLAYSGKGKFVIESIDLNRLIEEMGRMLEVSISKRANLRYNLTSHLPAVNVDATQVRQVLMNLVINASEALGDRNGDIVLSTGSVRCDREYLREIWHMDDLEEGLYVFMEVADTGCGMSPEVISKLFDPFFTTKFTGRGLGMAAVLGIVRGHRGAVRFKSEEGKGTTFQVLLPASTLPEKGVPVEEDAGEWRGEGTVLLVDDEDTVRDIGSEMLKLLGYTIVTAANGLEALDIVSTRDDITIVIVDLTMPHMDGMQCFNALRSFRPGLRVIMSSGFNEQEVTSQLDQKGLAGFIQKPYRLADLKGVLARL